MASKEQKVEILDRLVKAGHIDLKEALILIEDIDRAMNITRHTGFDINPSDPKNVRIVNL